MSLFSLQSFFNLAVAIVITKIVYDIVIYLRKKIKSRKRKQ